MLHRSSGMLLCFSAALRRPSAPQRPTSVATKHAKLTGLVVSADRFLSFDFIKDNL